MRRLLIASLLTVPLAGACKRVEEKTPPPPTSTSTARPIAAATVDRSKVPPAWKDVANELPDNWVASLAFIDTMLVEHEATAEKVTCHCCKKSLATCYRETRDRAEGACPPL